MVIREIIWLEEIEEKCALKHHVATDEVEGILHGRPHFNFVEKGIQPGEDVYLARGQTEVGRYLMIYFILKKDGAALIVSAREMTRRERRSYEKK